MLGSWQWMWVWKNDTKTSSSIPSNKFLWISWINIDFWATILYIDRYNSESTNDGEYAARQWSNAATSTASLHASHEPTATAANEFFLSDAPFEPINVCWIYDDRRKSNDATEHDAGTARNATDASDGHEPGKRSCQEKQFFFVYVWKSCIHNLSRIVLRSTERESLFNDFVWFMDLKNCGFLFIITT